MKWNGVEPKRTCITCGKEERLSQMVSTSEGWNACSKDCKEEWDKPSMSRASDIK